jgi:hypothetical protein
MHQQEMPVQKTKPIWIATLAMTTALFIAAYNNWPTHRPTGDKACFSDDDGQTWFVDSAYKVVPFDHNGKPAVRAMVFTYDNGHKQFVQALVRYTDKGRKILNDAILKAQEKNLPLSTLSQQFNAPDIEEVKTPGAGHAWVPRYSQGAKSVMDIESPDGSVVDMVIP